jgi:hypothetical protein
MRTRSLVSFVATATLLLSVAGCGATDSPVAPPQARPVAPSGEAQHTLLASPENIIPLLRNTPLASNISVTKTIGLLGGTISIPSAGLTVVVPALALSSSKTITITAMQGANLAYEFQPSGLRFNLPLVMTQDLTQTQAAPGGTVNPLNLFVGYFPNSANPTSVNEELGITLTLQPLIGVTNIWHFSGYIFAGGREDDGAVY